MNRVVLAGRLTKDVDVRYSAGEKQSAVARFTLAVDRRFHREGEQDADFISCVAFGNTAQFLEKYGRKGTKFIAEGRIQTGSYTNKEGAKVYTTDVVIDNIEFAESKNSGADGNGGNGGNYSGNKSGGSGSSFIDIPDGMSSELPFQ